MYFFKIRAFLYPLFAPVIASKLINIKYKKIKQKLDQNIIKISAMLRRILLFLILSKLKKKKKKKKKLFFLFVSILYLIQSTFLPFISFLKSHRLLYKRFLFLYFLNISNILVFFLDFLLCV